MPIDRGPWNALVDDDGTNLVGTVWNKDKIRTVILDPADLAYAKTVLFPSTTGTANDWNPGIRANTFIQWIGAGDLTITGIAGGVPGHTVTIENFGSGTISLLHGSSGSVAANRLNLNVVSGPTRLAARGTVTFIYQGALWLQVAYTQGAVITPPYSAASYTGSDAMTWTVEAGDIAGMAYLLQGNLLYVFWKLTGASIGGTASTILNINNSAWGGYSAYPAYGSLAYLNYAGIIVTGFIQVVGTQIQLLRFDGGPFSVATNNMYTYGAVVFPVT